MKKRSLNSGWLFHLDASRPWISRQIGEDETRVDLPHDFRIALNRDPASPGDQAEGFYPGAFGQYRRDFELTEREAAGTVMLNIDGAYRFCEVRINRQLVCMHRGGYSPFLVDLTGKVKPGVNTLHLTTNCAMLPASRWYTGAGLYRSVELLTGDAPCIAPRGVRVRRTAVHGDRAELEVHTELIGPMTAVIHTLYDAEGSRVAQGGDGVLIIRDAKLWSDAHPYLYTLKSQVMLPSGTADEVVTRVGLRTIEVDAARGLRINGEPVKLRGGCIHHDNGPLGAVSDIGLERRKLTKLKEAGYNAVRCAHNPPSTALLDACDELGVYVIDEAFDAWREGKRPFDEHIFFETDWQDEITNMVTRDRNHPSVILWSTGNEIYERSGASEGAAWAHRLAVAVRALDDSRPVMNALCNFFEDSDIAELALNSMKSAGKGKDYWAAHSEKFASALDVVGYNYLLDRYEKDHALFPQRVICGTESFPLQALENWQAVKHLSHVIGDFVWVAWDYIGESGLGRSEFDTKQNPAGTAGYPWHIANCGDFDICGEKRPQSHYRDFVWLNRTKPYLAVQHPAHFEQEEKISAWGWPDLMESWNFAGFEEKPVRATVYSAGDAVELYLNGEKVASGSVESHRTVVEIPYRPGRLEAVSLKKGQEIGRCELRTSGSAAQFLMEAEPSFGGNYRFVTLTAVDQNGLRCTDFEESVRVEVSGAAFAALAGGDPCAENNYAHPEAKMNHGRLLLALRAPQGGEVKLRCVGGGMDTETTLQLEA